ncbi:MAG: ABC transporter permease [Kiloniellales bacterium]
MSRDLSRQLVLLLPLAILVGAFFLLPVGRLILVGASGEAGAAAYTAVLTTPRYFESFLNTILLSAGVTVVTLAISTAAGLFLQRNVFPGRDLLIALMTFPLAFPGVVVGFMVIMLAGRQGVIGSVTDALFDEKLVFAYSMAGLFMGYVYFSIPRVILTIMAAIEKLDPALEEAARSLGAGPWTVLRDVVLPALKPAFLASGAVCFATAMGAFGTAFTLATDIDVLPMTIYTEFVLYANFATAAALSIVLGAITWLVLALSRSLAGNTVAAAG